MKAVLKHELKNYFHGMTAYLFIAFLLLFVGLGAMLYNIESAVANFEYVLQFVCIGLVVIIPVLTMRIIAEEKKQKTDQLLYSLPLKTGAIVLGKYFSLLIVFLIPLAVISVYPLIFARFGEVYLPTSYGSLFAFFCMGAALIAVGTFVSSLTDNMGLAVGITIPLLLFNYYSVTLADYVSASAVGSVIALMVLVLALALIVRKVTGDETVGMIVGAVCMLALGITLWLDASAFDSLLPNLMSALSVFDRFDDFVSGVFDLSDIVYYLSVIVFFLFLTVQSMDKRRYN